MLARRVSGLLSSGTSGSSALLCGHDTSSSHRQGAVYCDTTYRLAILVIIVQVLDYLTPLIGTKYSGGSKWGNRGCIAGTVIGIFLFPPWGIIFGPLVGAVIGELLGGKLTHEALKAGLGAFVGFLLGVILKVSLCGYFVVVFISALF